MSACFDFLGQKTWGGGGVGKLPMLRHARFKRGRQLAAVDAGFSDASCVTLLSTGMNYLFPNWRFRSNLQT